MDRSTLPIALALVCLSIIPGCKLTPEQEARQLQQKWLEMKQDDHNRLLGEDRLAAEQQKSFWGGIKSTGDSIGRGFQHLWDITTGDTPEKNAVMLTDRNNPDKRREAIFYLSDRKFGRQDPYEKQYSVMAGMDADFTVRAAAIRALNRARDRDYTLLYIEWLEDPKQNDLVHLEAAKALANIPDDKAVAPLAKHLANVNENRDVRIACADALRNYHNSQAAQALVRGVEDRDFGVAWQARRSLFLMTGQDFHYDGGAWLKWMAQSKPFG